LNVSGSGVTSCADGNAAGTRSAAIARGWPPASGTTAGSGDRCAADASSATVCPSPVITGLHSRPLPLVTGTAPADPSTGTLKR
jgi:hypothetical protein